jgi:lauroyl/myristoyl acyltransferase
MNTRTTLRAALEIVLWWAGLTVLWLVLISSVDALERVVGASAALVGAVAARAARRAVGAR